MNKMFTGMQGFEKSLLADKVLILWQEKKMIVIVLSLRVVCESTQEENGWNCVTEKQN